MRGDDVLGGVPPRWVVGCAAGDPRVWGLIPPVGGGRSAAHDMLRYGGRRSLEDRLALGVSVSCVSSDGIHASVGKSSRVTISEDCCCCLVLWVSRLDGSKSKMHANITPPPGVKDKTRALKERERTESRSAGNNLYQDT
eukprot:8018303-Pyramimonas_sp.AAC.2